MSHADAMDAVLASVADEFGSPAYVYFTDHIEGQIETLRTIFDNRFSISYAAKSNPNPGLLAWLATRIENLDISSIGEMRLGKQAGWAPEAMSFTGPGKLDRELREGIENGLGELIVESVDEARRADRIAAELGRRQRIMVRIGPNEVPKGFGDQMAGRPSPFGVDIEEIHEAMPQILALDNLDLVGLHIYSGTQCLNAASICDNYRIFMRIYREVCERYDITPERLVFGSGLGIPYFDYDKPLDAQAVGDGIRDDLAAFQAEPRFAGTELMLELGRFLVGGSGYYVTRVTALKQSRGTSIAICDGGMNHHIVAAGHFGMVIHRNYVMHRVGGGEPAGKVNLHGPLCTPLDRLASGIELPKLQVGDLIAVHSSGAYGVTASPVNFISHKPPTEVLVVGNERRDVSRKLSDIY